MATADLTAPASPRPALGDQWRSLTRVATLVAVLTSPAAFVWFHEHQGLRLRYALLLTLIEVAAFRGLVDLTFRRFIASPSLFGEEREELRTEDVVMRRRLSCWRAWWRWAWRGIVLITLSWLLLVFFGHGLTWGATAHKFFHAFSLFGNTSVLAGTGTPGFAGDGGLASAAQLSTKPRSMATPCSSYPRPSRMVRSATR